MRRFVGRYLAVATLAGVALAEPSPAPAEERVKFDRAATRSARGGESSQIDEIKAAAPIPGYLTTPAGAGPFPAVVLLHSCLGLPANRKSIGAMFAGWGYVALFVDDFTTRGVRQTCAADFDAGLPDAFGALAFLSRLRGVDPKRIAVVGYSQGGDTALRIAAAGGRTFRAAVAFYPPCQNQAEARLAIPTLILIGQSDEVTPAADCRRLAENQAADRSELKLVVYPHAFHLFDDPGLAAGARLFGMWLRYDPDAARQSRSAMRDFLAQNLAP